MIDINQLIQLKKSRKEKSIMAFSINSIVSYVRRATQRRALSTRGAFTGDCVQMEGLSFYGHHGVLPAETALGQKFTIDTTMWCSLREAGVSDDLTTTVDYTATYEAIRAIVEGPPRQLIESVAEEIASTVLATHARVQDVRVAVHKPNVALRGPLRTVGVTIERSREGREER